MRLLTPLVLFVLMAAVIGVELGAGDQGAAGTGLGETFLPKTIESDKLRLLFWIGLEGSGHHYVLDTFQNIAEKNGEIPGLRNACPLSFRPYSIEMSMAISPSEYAMRIKQAKKQMRELASQEGNVQPPGALFTFCARLSYPRNNGEQKVMQYVDAGLVAEIAEAEGVDFRILYLKRSAHEMLVSNSIHRNIVSWKTLGKAGEVAPEELFMEYARVLLTDIAVVHSFLAEIDPKFVVCHDFAYLGDSQQAREIADFVAPSKSLADAIHNSLIEGASHHSEFEPLLYNSSEVVTDRLQRKLDQFESVYCKRRR